LRLTALPTYPLDSLGRYEHLLWRQAGPDLGETHPLVGNINFLPLKARDQ
jgi:hypothetical protein